MSLARVELKKAVVTVEEDGGLLFVNRQGEEEGTLRLASVDPPDTWQRRWRTYADPDTRGTRDRYREWVRTKVYRQRQAGYAVATIALPWYVLIGTSITLLAGATGIWLSAPDKALVGGALQVGSRTVGAVNARWRSGVTVIGGQGQQRGRIVRFGHIGYVDVQDIAAALAAVERALAEAGADVERGTAVPAALEAHAEPVAA